MIDQYTVEEVKPSRVWNLKQQRARFRRRVLTVIVGLGVAVALLAFTNPAEASERHGRKVERQHGNVKKTCRCKPKVNKHKKHRKDKADHGKRWKQKRHGKPRWKRHHKQTRRYVHKSPRRYVDKCERRDGGGRVCRKVCKPRKHIAPPVKRHQPKPPWRKRPRYHKPKPRVIVDKPGFRDQPKPVAPKPKPVKAPTVVLSPPVSKTAPKKSAPTVTTQPMQTAEVLPFTGSNTPVLLLVGLVLILLGALAVGGSLVNVSARRNAGK